MDTTTDELKRGIIDKDRLLKVLLLAYQKGEQSTSITEKDLITLIKNNIR